MTVRTEISRMLSGKPPSRTSMLAPSPVQIPGSPNRRTSFLPARKAITPRSTPSSGTCTSSPELSLRPASTGRPNTARPRISRNVLGFLMVSQDDSARERRNSHGNGHATSSAHQHVRPASAGVSKSTAFGQSVNAELSGNLSRQMSSLSTPREGEEMTAFRRDPTLAHRQSRKLKLSSPTPHLIFYPPADSPTNGSTNSSMFAPSLNRLHTAVNSEDISHAGESTSPGGIHSSPGQTPSSPRTPSSSTSSGRKFGVDTFGRRSSSILRGSSCDFLFSVGKLNQVCPTLTFCLTAARGPVLCVCVVKRPSFRAEALNFGLLKISRFTTGACP